MHLIIDQRYDDFDRVRHDVRNWDLDFRLFGSSGFRGHIRQLASPTVIVGLAKFRCRLQQLGSTPAGYRTFGIPDESCGEFWWRGYQVTNHNLLMFAEDNVLDSASSARFAIYAVSIHRNEVERLATTLGVTPPPATAIVLHPTANLMAELRLAARLAVFEARSHNRATAANALAEKLICATSHEETLVSSSPRQRDLAIRRVIDFLHEPYLPSVRLPELCAIAHVSERTLQYAFKERYGVSPYKFAMQWRLNSARRDLLASHPGDKTVAQIARQHGFDNPSLFTDCYKELFAELPSMTLAAMK
jgi:AraC family ethanolamine operon transcriptional activator